MLETMILFCAISVAVMVSFTLVFLLGGVVWDLIKERCHGR